MKILMQGDKCVKPVKKIIITFFILLNGCRFTGTERFSCEFPDNTQTIFSFNEIENSITLGGISFFGQESWTRDIQITEEAVSLYYVQGLATRTDADEYVGFKNLYHYQFNRQTKTLAVETKLDSIQTGPADWTHPARKEKGQCEIMNDPSYWKLFITQWR